MQFSGKIEATSRGEAVGMFVWQHFLLLIALFIMTLGVALCVRSNLGSSVISSLPLAFTLAGNEGLVPPLTIGEYTNILNAFLVVGQIAVLRRHFQAAQLLQLLVGFVFGFLIDVNMYLTSGLTDLTLPSQAAAQFAGCTILGLGVALEVRCGSVTMPGEGLPVAVSRVSGVPFAKVKIYIDTTLVVLAVIAGYVFFGHWVWNVVGIGTLFAMVYVGLVVKFLSARLGWFDRLLYSRPGVRRYLYGLARFVYRRR